jgi:GT2 family glycosyltransferase
VTARPKIVLLGMLTSFPVPGMVWLTMQYLVGLRRLGYDVFYVEAHSRVPSTFSRERGDLATAAAAAYIDRTLSDFGFGGNWAFHALHDDGTVYGLSRERLRGLYRSAELILNLHGGTEPLPEHSETGRLVFLETDPVELELEISRGDVRALEYLKAHSAFFTWAENLGSADCRLPPPEGFDFRPTRQPVVLDFWHPYASGDGDRFTTVANWHQPWRNVLFQGETYTWSKHYEFLKLLEIPRRTSERIELALTGFTESDRRLLVDHGWSVVEARRAAGTVETYRRYVTASRGEVTVAKDQNVRLRTGWFSDRSATYLAAGRPVVTQDTGFGSVLPTGAGLFAFTTPDDVVEAVEQIAADPIRHRREAFAIAREHFDARVVLTNLLAELSLRPPVRGRRATGAGLPPELSLTPVSRRPLRLRAATLESVLTRPLPDGPRVRPDAPTASIVVVTANNVALTRMSLESVLANSDRPFEVVVVDNGSWDETPAYLAALEARDARLRPPLLESRNLGFPAACNRALQQCRGEAVVFLNNDVVVPPRWLSRLVAHLEAPDVGLVCAVANRAPNEAQVASVYDSYAELAAAAEARAAACEGRSFDIPVAPFLCAAARRAVLEDVGPLDERFGVGLFEDDDYARRVREAGLRVVCAEDVLVHHFGEGTFGDLAPSGDYADAVERNRRLFEQKWGVAWQPHRRRHDEEYTALAERVRTAARETLPQDATVVVVSKGDEALLDLGARRAWHFPQTDDGAYAGHYPADSSEAIAQLDQMRARGGDFLLVPEPAGWWLEHYSGLRAHLETRHSLLLRAPGTCSIFDLRDCGGGEEATS